MKSYNNLILVGTSHIAQQSLDDVKNVITQHNPDIIGVELDKRRASALLSNQKSKVHLSDITKIGVKGYFFVKLGAWAEKKLGSVVGTKPGDEMKTAIILAKKSKKKLTFVDQDIEITLKKLSKRISWKEKWNFFVDILKSVFLRKQETIDFDLRTVPGEKTIKKLTDQLKKRYPNIYDVLIKERNEYMAKAISKIMVKNEDKKIVVFVGAGHETEILNLIKYYLNKGIIYSYSVG